MQSGNLNFSVPLVKAQARGGWGATFALNYNSQVWRKDAAATWKLGQDVGYGFGWKLLAGSITPFWGDYWTIHHYVFTDATGAEYRLDQNSGGVWTSREGTYVSYDANTYRLYFPDGSFWQMDAVSSGAEQGAGTRYPTVMEDSNGNQILIRYQTGVGVTWENSSARLNEIEDVRAVSTCCPTRYRTYSFSYNTDTIPHLTGITNYINTSEGYALGYSTPQTLWSPFVGGGTYGTAQMLQSVTMSGLGLTTSFEYGSNSAGELTRVVFPYQGDLRWTYIDFTYEGNRTYREVASRQLTKQSGAAQSTYTITHGSGDGQKSVHSVAVLADPVAGERAWFFETNTASAYVGLAMTYEERELGGQVKSRQGYTWTQDSAGRPYIGTALSTLDPGAGYQKQAKTEQTLDGYGNLTQMKIYDYGNLATAARTYTNTYLTGTAYTSRYIRNRVQTSQVTNGTQTVWTNVSYDNGVYGILSPGPRQHDTANYGTAFTVRGNPSVITSPQGITGFSRDYTGTVIQTSDYFGHYVNYANAYSTNYAAPGTITPNGNGSLATSLGYSAFLGLQSVNGPNGASSAVTYDAYARPQSTYSPHGAVTNWTYTNSPATKTGTTNGHWEKTSYDGLGRVIKVETGDGGSTKTIVETQYEACACSPLGKVKKVSQPYAPGGTVYWTVYNYDGLGRVTSAQLPGNTGTTSYVYEGNTVKVTDAAGKWKKYVTDVFGNLTQVAEPQPGGGSDYLTNYTYNLANQLTQVSMTRGAATQTRTFTYDTQQRLATAANPETGTVTYGYNGDNTVASKVDAKNQRVEYSYDAYQRVTQVRRYAVNGGAEDTCQRVNFAYDANPYDGSYTVNSLGRLSAAQWGHETACAVGRFTEMYSYTAAGLVTKKRLRLGRVNYSLAATNADLDAVYGYNNEGRMTSVMQPGYYTPGQYWNNGAAYTLGYDTMGRLNTLTQTAPSSQAVISGITYGGGNQITQVSYGTGQAQTRTYNERLQMTRMTVAGVMDLEYVYSGSANNGQITSMKNYISGEEVIYQYDTLKRLTSAATTAVGPQWGQSFGYDGFGNLLSKSVVKGSAPVMSIAVDGATNRVVGWGYDANGNVTYMPGSFTSMGYDVENRLVAASLWSGGGEQYGYGPDNKRVWRVKATGGTEVYFYGVNGERQGTYSWGVIDNNTGDIGFFLVGLESVVPKGLQVNRDRLGSVMVSGTTRYYPYGEEAPVTGEERDKYGTYRRDGNTGLDYAEQRYYSSGVGRFLTADP
ncbi:MAG: hypothetical protein LC126_18290, partial [Bryobacterales bacterium]|nr:hypothetical protein [Bryobacterales bacterium]